MNATSFKNMRRIGMNGAGGPDVLAIAEAAVPQAKPHEVVIEVEAAGVNRPDVLQRQGAYPPPPGASPHLDLEVAGTIVETGQDVSEWNVGDKVCALVDGGGYADFCVQTVSSHSRQHRLRRRGGPARSLLHSLG